MAAVDIKESTSAEAEPTAQLVQQKPKPKRIRNKTKNKLRAKLAVKPAPEPEAKAQSSVGAAVAAVSDQLAAVKKKKPDVRVRSDWKSGGHRLVGYFGYNPFCGMLEGVDDFWEDEDYHAYVEAQLKRNDEQKPKKS
jgi:hypothetical protein